MSTGAQTALSFDGRTPNLSDCVRAAIRSSELQLRVSFPATVSEVHADGRVAVRPDFSNVVYTDDGEQDLGTYEIPNIPVLNLGQGKVGGGYLQFPIEVGHKGLVLVSDRSLDGWYQNGIPGPPAGYHTHEVVDGIFMPGLRDATRALPAQDPLAAVLEHSQVKIGAGATAPAARFGDDTGADVTMAIWIGAVSTFINNLVAGSVIPPSDFGKITGGSTKVKIE